jgi:hypothetical protein
MWHPASNGVRFAQNEPDSWEDLVDPKFNQLNLSTEQLRHSGQNSSKSQTHFQLDYMNYIPRLHICLHINRYHFWFDESIPLPQNRNDCTYRALF